MAGAAQLRLFPLAAPDAGGMASLAAELAGRAAVAPAELEGLAALAREQLPAAAEVRGAVIAGDAEELCAGLEALAAAAGERLEIGRRHAVGCGDGHRIGFLFPGQGAPARTGAGAVGEAIPAAAGVFTAAGIGAGDPVPDELVQLSVVAASLAGLAAARELGIVASLALGHSLGELVALHWAGACDEPTLLRLARARGEAMTEYADPGGAMAALRCDAGTAAALAGQAGVVVACHNSPRSSVVSGDAAAVGALLVAAKERGLAAMPLPVVGAFHSPLMRPAQPVFAAALGAVAFEPPRGPVFSTVTGARLDPAADLRRLLLDQLVDPVLFADPLAAAAGEVDLLLDLGPGRILAPLVTETTATPLVSMRVGDPAPRGLLEVAAAAFAAGAFEAGLLAAPTAEGVAG